MSANENTKIQVNYKTPAGTLVNVYADHPDELDSLLAELAKRVAGVTSLEGLLAGGSAVSGISAPPAQQGRGLPPRTEQAPTAPPQPVVEGKNCLHGPMTHRSGVSGRGPWSGWFCPLPKERKSEQCPAIFE